MFALLNANLTAAIDINADELITPHIPFAGVPWLTSTLLTCFLMTFIVLIFCIVVRFVCIPRWEKKKSPGMLQTVLESVVGMFEKEGRDSVGHNTKFLAPWYIGVCCFILVGVLTELFGFRPPISDINIAFALSFSTFILMWVFGFKEKKLGRFKRYFNPINLLTDSIVPFSMAIRLFGSVFSGYVIMHLIYTLGWFAIGPLGLLGTLVSTLFHAFIQAYIFMMLSYAFISEATE